MKRSRASSSSNESKDFLDLVCKAIKSSSTSTVSRKFDDKMVRSIIETSLKNLPDEVEERVRNLIESDFDFNVKYLTNALNGLKNSSSSSLPSSFSQDKKRSRKNKISMESSREFANAVTSTTGEARKISLVPCVPSCMWIHTKLEHLGKTRPSQINTSDILDCFRGDISGCRETSGLNLYAERFRHYFEEESRVMVRKKNVKTLNKLRTCCESFLSILTMRVSGVNDKSTSSINCGNLYVPNSADWRAAVEEMSAPRKQLAKAAFGSISMTSTSSQDWRSDVARILSTYVWISVSFIILQSDKKKRKKLQKSWFRKAERVISTCLETSVQLCYVPYHICNILDRYAQESNESNENLEMSWKLIFQMLVSLENMIERVPRENVKKDGLRYLLRFMCFRRTRDVFESRFRACSEKKILRNSMRWLQETKSVCLANSCPKVLLNWLMDALSGTARGISRRAASTFSCLVRDDNSFDARILLDKNGELTMENVESLIHLYAGHCYGDDDDFVVENAEDEDELKEDEGPMFFIDSVGNDRARAQSKLLRSETNGVNEDDDKSSSWHESTQRLIEEISGSDDDDAEDE